MRQSLKIAISLLASLLLFAAFAVLGESGLFKVLQASFFLPRIEKVYQDELERAATTINTFHESNLETFKSVAQRPFIAASFSTNLDDATIKAWTDTSSQLGLPGIRLIGADGKRIFYSTLEADLKDSAVGRKAFRNYNEDNSSLPASQLAVSAGNSLILNDRPRGHFVYAIAVSGPGAQAGTLLFSVPQRDLLTRLAKSADVSADNVTLVGTNGLVIDFLPPGGEEALGAIWASGSGAHYLTTPLTLAGTSTSYHAFSFRLSDGGYVSLLEPSAKFEMTDVMKGLLLGTFLLTVFLLLFLILNLRSDPLEVLRQRVKRFQVQLITDLVETRSGVDWGKWRGELESRRDEITWQIQRGLGRVSRKKKPIIDEYMTKSWAEILDLVSRRTEAPPSAGIGAQDIARLESMIQAALQGAKFVLPAQKPPAPRPLQVEEIRAEEVSEGPGERGASDKAPARAGGAQKAAVPKTPAASSEAVQDAEGVEEAEAVEEAESVEEAEAVEEAAAPAVSAARVAPAASFAPAAESEAVQDAEGVEEAEAIEEAESVEEAETVEEAAAPAAPAARVAPAASSAPAAESEAVEDAEGVEDAESLEEVELVEDVEAVEEAAARPAPAARVAPAASFTPAAPAARVAPAASFAPAAESEAVEDAETVEEVEASEDVGEAEVVEEAEAVEEVEAAEEMEAVEEPVKASAAESEKVGGTAGRTPAGSGLLKRAQAVEKVDQRSVLGIRSVFPGGSAEDTETAFVGDMESIDIGEVAEVVPLEESASSQTFLARETPAGDSVGSASPRVGTGVARSPAVSDFMEIRIPGGALNQVGTFDLDAEFMDTSGETLEELEALQDIEPLPPEPIEEGLEMLPSADDEPAQAEDREGGMTAMTNEDARDTGPEEPVKKEQSQPVPPAVEFEDVADFEELEVVDEEVAAAEPAQAPAAETGTQEDVAALIDSGAVKSWTIEEFRQIVDEAGSAIVMENGVFRIKEEVYKAGEVPREGRGKDKLREIAQEVVRHDAEPAFDAVPAGGNDAEEAAGYSGIGDLIRDEESLDLLNILPRESAPAHPQAMSVEVEKSTPLRLKRGGIDWDELLSFYPRSFVHTIQMKSLVEVSRRVSAVSACLFIKKSEGYWPDLTVGFGERTLPLLHFEAPDPFFLAFMATRKVVAINRNPAEIRSLSGKIDPDDIRYTKRMLLVPATFRAQDAYLLLSFAPETDIQIESLVTRLVIR